MKGVRYLREEIEVHESMKGLVEVYEEMAAKTMREIRDAILASREYYRGLAKLSSEVGVDLAKLEQRGKKGKAIVLFSADEGLYGEILDKVFAEFVGRAKSERLADIYVCGKASWELMKMFAPEIRYQAIALPKDGGLKEVIGMLWGYAQVELYFGQFESLARQVPGNRELSATEIALTQKNWSGEVINKLSYLYEPGLAEVAQVFGEQIFAGIVDQSYREGELAKNASRLMHLDSAVGKIERQLVKSYRALAKGHKRRSSRKQNTQLSGYRVMNKARRSYAG